MNKSNLKNKKSSIKGLTRREILKYGIYTGLSTGLSGSLWLSGCRKQRRGTPNIIVIVLDTTRVDRLGCYGYWRQTSPNLDKLADQSVLYTWAIAPSSWTLPSHASLFTGKFTTSHGARSDTKGALRLTDGVQNSSIPNLDKNRASPLAQNEVTLAMILKEAGYSTGAVVAGPWLKRAFGLNKGFDYYDDNEISTLNGRLASQVTTCAINWLEKLEKKKFFLFLNYFDPHKPYKPPDALAKEFLTNNGKGPNQSQKEYIINGLYDAEICYMDRYIGKLLEKLKAENLYDNTWIIVTADHGELLGEHGQFWHGHFLYQEEIHIPLFMKYPFREARATRTDTGIQLTDILPMICDKIGVAVPENIQGSSPPNINHPIISETYPLPFVSNKGDWRVIFDGFLKFHWNSKDQHQLFNLKNDPAEDKNLCEIYYEKSKKMEEELNQYIVNLPKPGRAAPAKMLDKQTKEALKSLGYVK